MIPDPELGHVCTDHRNQTRNLVPEYRRRGMGDITYNVMVVAVA